MTPARIRSMRSRKARKDAGGSTITVNLDKRATDALAAMRLKHGGNTKALHAALAGELK